VRLTWRRTKSAEHERAIEAEVARLEERDLADLFAAPRWLSRLGRQAWLLVGIAIALVGLIWILNLTSSIVLPVITAGIIAAVASPLVSSMQRRGLHRAAGAAVVLLILLGIGVVVLALVLGGIIDQGTQIKDTASQALDNIESWFNDAGSGGTADAKSDLSNAVTVSGSTLLQGVADGIRGLTSLAFFLSFTLFSTFFLLKDGPTIRRFAERHMGIPINLARLVSGRVIGSMRRYFLGVTVVAVFNGTVVGLGALILGVPLAGTIAIVTAVTAYVPFIGAFVSGAFAVLLTLGSEGTTDAIIMIVICVLANGLLQNIVQPIAFGATLDLNPLAVLIVTISAGGIFGMVGMIVAAPLTSAAVHISQDLREVRRQVAAAEERTREDVDPEESAAPA
jgi:predicted PurR-regulated permease PerM